MSFLPQVVVFLQMSQMRKIIPDERTTKKISQRRTRTGARSTWSEGDCWGLGIFTDGWILPDQP
jgi:hypothetical protein